MVREQRLNIRILPWVLAKLMLPIKAVKTIISQSLASTVILYNPNKF